MSYTDNKTEKIILNILKSEEQFETITDPSDTEIYLAPDNTQEDIEELKREKQDVLTASTGINIDSANNISTQNIVFRTWTTEEAEQD